MVNYLKLSLLLSFTLILTGCSLFTPAYTKTECQESCLSKNFNASTCLYAFEATANLEHSGKCLEPEDSQCFCYFQHKPKSKIPVIEEDKITAILKQITLETQTLFTLPSNAELNWDLSSQKDKYVQEVIGKQIKYIGQYSLVKIGKSLNDQGFTKNSQGFHNDLIVCQIKELPDLQEVIVMCGNIIKKPEITPLNELLDPANELLNKELKISGFVSKLGELDCSCFELVTGNYKLKIWYDQLIEPQQTDLLLNRHLVHLTGELISLGNEKSIPEFRIYNLKIIK